MQRASAGDGKAMLDHLEALARTLKIEELVLDARLNAASLYRRCGYVGHDEAIYHSPSGLQWACIPKKPAICVCRAALQVVRVGSR